NNREKYTVVQVAPAIRVSLGEEFGMEPGSIVTGKIVSSLRRMGFDRIFDTNFSADLTIIEEANELISRLKQGKVPMLTSCSPGWIKYVEHFYPEVLDFISTCKSPHEMQGALIKSYYAEKFGIDPEKLFVVSIMPCTAKKYESQRPELGEKYPDVDAVLTTRELARMIKTAGIDFQKLADDFFDDPLGESTGAAAIFGSSGGVMEAALRTAYFSLTGQDMEDVNFRPARGLEGVKEAKVNIADSELLVAVVSGLKNIDKFLNEIKAGNSPYHFIEVMACPGGCINGGGQPLPSSPEKVEKRMKAIYKIDGDLPKRCSHHNESVKKLYQDFLGEPNSPKAHHLLHTRFIEREMV
ncbi:iron hydrogenase small subunit, partial [candidate division KSB1 bacterium]|nr:iron hydrogenase small subunit [candidate division KSB1 bacterium]